MQPSKFFNFAMPFEMYIALRKLSVRSEAPIAELVRAGIRHILEDKPSIPQTKKR